LNAEEWSNEKPKDSVSEKKTYFISQKKNRDADEEELQRGLEQSLREVEELGKVSNDRNNSFYHSSYGKF
jgi:predicted Ser/Thr protein kinase